MTINKLTSDDINDIAIAIVDKLVECGLIKDCIDTDDDTEFEVQDIIAEAIESANLYRLTDES